MWRRWFSSSFRSSSRWIATATTVATTTTISTGFMLMYFQEEDEPSSSSSDRRLRMTTAIPGNRTFCDADSPLMFRISHLRRRATIRQMEKTAARTPFASQYRIAKLLGEGAFGKVYMGEHIATGEKVAIKKINKECTDNITFQREMDALLRLRQKGCHPNICSMRENFDEGDYYYVVLDLVVGGEMFDALCEDGAYSEADAARLIREVACALAFLHGIGIVHGDLKPENLMLSSRERANSVIKLVDFGCAQTSPDVEDEPDVLAARIQTRRRTVNTPAYSPPEVIARNANKKRKHYSIDPSFDMWSLGVIMYIMLTGVHPFDLYGNATDEEIEKNVLSHKMPPLQNSPVTAHLSDDAIEVIQNLLQWDPNRRLTAQQLLDNPWVRGETARTSKMADSDKKLSAYRAFKSKLAAKVFADMVAMSEEGDEINQRASVLENAFHRLDPSNKGYVTPKDLQHIMPKSISSTEPPVTVSPDEQLSLSGFSDLLSEDMKDRYFPTGHMIYHEGDVGDNMFFLNSGSVQIFTKDGFSKIMSKPGDFFGEGALLSPNKIRSASIRCLTPVHVIEVDRAYFEKYMASDKELKLNLREKDKTRKRQRAKTMLSLQHSMDRRSFRHGEKIFREGDKGDELYFLEMGQVDVSVQGNTVFLVDKGGLLGMHSVVFDRPRNTTATCISDSCKFHVLHKNEFAAFLKNHPSLKDSIRDMCLRREFQKAVCLKTKRPFPKNEKELREAFDAVDYAHAGVLKLRNIRDLIQEFEHSFSEDDIQDILKSLDLDESGEVSWTEFKKIFFDRKPEDSIH